MRRRVRCGDPQRRSYWEEVLRRWREAGQSVRAFCRAEGLRESAFYFWRRKLADAGHRVEATGGGRLRTLAARPSKSPRLRTATERPCKSPRRSDKPSFLPVQLAGIASRCSDQDAAGVEIVLGAGRTVRVLAGFDRQTLADVLSVLEVRPC